MIVVDINLLLYAVVSGFPEHKKARRWWEQTLNTDSEIGLVPPVLFGFVRLSTHPRVLDRPLSVDGALEHVAQWLARPQLTFLLPGPRHLEIAFQLLRGLGVAANLTTDVQIAAAALENDADLFSNDSDFSRFRGLRWKNPLE